MKTIVKALYSMSRTKWETEKKLNTREQSRAEKQRDKWQIQRKQ